VPVFPGLLTICSARVLAIFKNGTRKP